MQDEQDKPESPSAAEASDAEQTGVALALDDNGQPIMVPAEAANADVVVRLQQLRLSPQQGEMPFAVVQGKPVTELPKDLYHHKSSIAGLSIAHGKG